MWVNSVLRLCWCFTGASAVDEKSADDKSENSANGSLILIIRTTNVCMCTFYELIFAHTKHGLQNRFWA